MSFVQAFLESGRSKGEYLVQLEGWQKIALESFALDALQIVDIFNTILAEDAGFKMDVLPVQNASTGLIIGVPDGNDTRFVFIDIGYVPDAQEYSVSERDSGVSGSYSEFDMKLAVAGIVLKNLPDEQYLKFYRALLGEEQTAPVDSVVPFTGTNANYVQHEPIPVQPITQEAVVTPFPSSGFVSADEVFATIETHNQDSEGSDEDDIWGDDDSDSSVDKHLSTDVVMR